MLKELLEGEQEEKVKDKLNVPWTAANKAGPGVYTSPHVNLTQRMVETINQWGDTTLPNRGDMDRLYNSMAKKK